MLNLEVNDNCNLTATVSGTMLQFANWNEVLETIECLGQAEDAFLDQYSELNNDQYDAAIAADRQNLDAPIEKYVSALGGNSLYTKYAGLDAAELDPTGVDTFAYRLFASKAVRAVLNIDFQLSVNGDIYDALNGAFSCSTRACAEAEIANASAQLCTRVKRARVYTIYSVGSTQYRFNTLASFYPFGPIQMVTVNFDNEIRANNMWKGSRANLQTSAAGPFRLPIICSIAGTFSDLTTIRYVKGIELRKVKSPDIWKQDNDFTTTCTSHGSNGAQNTFTW